MPFASPVLKSVCPAEEVAEALLKKVKSGAVPPAFARVEVAEPLMVNPVVVAPAPIVDEARE